LFANINITEPPLPMWLQAQVKRLKAMGLGTKWDELLETWIRLETEHGFKGSVCVAVLSVLKADLLLRIAFSPTRHLIGQLT
jgi:hypothetical protein